MHARGVGVEGFESAMIGWYCLPLHNGLNCWLQIPKAGIAHTRLISHLHIVCVVGRPRTLAALSMNKVMG